MNFLLLGDALLLLQLGDIQHTAHQSAQAFGFVRHNLQIMPPPFLGDGAVQYAVHIAGNGGHGSLQLVGHVGHEFLPGVFTLLQGRGHVVEGQGQLLHFLAAILVDFDSGVQLTVAEGGSRPCQLLQGLTLPPGEGHDPQYSDENHEHGNREKNIGDFIQNLLRPGGGGGHDDNAQLIVPADDGGRHHIALLIV